MSMGNVFEGLEPAVTVSLVAALIATFGLVAALTNSKWSEKYSVYFSAFAAGVLITTALRLIPEGLETTPYAPFLVPVGYVGFYIFNALLGGHQGGQGKFLAPLFAIGFHSFIDGLEYGILFEHDAFIGLLASVGLILHEFAEGVILFVLLRQAGLGNLNAFFWAFLGAALTTPAGAVVAVGSLQYADFATLGILISVAAGALLYVGATHLAGHMKAQERRATLLPFCAGVVVALVLSLAHYGMEEGHPSHSDHHAEKEMTPH